MCPIVSPLKVKDLTRLVKEKKKYFQVNYTYLRLN